MRQFRKCWNFIVKRRYETLYHLHIHKYGTLFSSFVQKETQSSGDHKYSFKKVRSKRGKNIAKERGVKYRER